MILGLAIIVGAIGIVQQVFVPAWVKNDEWDHYVTIKNDVSSIPKLVALTASSKNPNVVTLNLGVKRGDYPFLMTPPDSGSSVVSRDLKLVVKYNITLPNGTVEQRVLPITTAALIVKPEYYYLPETEFVYEHGYVFSRSGKNNVTLVDQIGFSNRTFTFYIFKTNFNSISVNDVYSIPLNPISTGGKVSVVNATLRFETLNPDYWVDELRKLNLNPVKIGNNISVNLTNAVMSISIVGEEGDDVRITYRPYLYVSEIRTFIGDTEIIEVVVLDQFGNPVPNVPVNGSTTIGSLDSANKTTDANGVARFIFEATEEGTGNVTFESGGNTASADVYVTEPAGGPPRWSKNNNDTLVISPDFKWTGIHGASEIWLRNAAQIGDLKGMGGGMMGDDDMFEIKFVLYDSKVFYYFEVKNKNNPGMGNKKVKIWKDGVNIFECNLNPSIASDMFNSNGVNLLNNSSYSDRCNNLNKLDEIKSFLQSATLADPISLQVQEIEEGWKVEIQIK